MQIRKQRGWNKNNGQKATSCSILPEALRAHAKPGTPQSFWKIHLWSDYSQTWKWNVGEWGIWLPQSQIHLENLSYLLAIILQIQICPSRWIIRLSHISCAHIKSDDTNTTETSDEKSIRKPRVNKSERQFTKSYNCFLIVAAHVQWSDMQLIASVQIWLQQESARISSGM